MSQSTSPARGVAIIGMAGRFPQAPTLDDFWRKLRDGVECISRFSDAELAADGVPLEQRTNPRYVPARGVIDGRELFDAAFFGISPREAEVTDPQQRMLLECAWEALENAGYDPERSPGSIGVFAGVSMNSYFIERILRAPAVSHSAAFYQAFIGNDKDFCATRLSYKLGLRGPSINVQTACSTSLVAVHMAAQSLLTFQCDMAIAGAASVEASHAHGYVYEEGMILSPDGHCRAYDAAAGGTVGGEGVSAVVLKRVADALADGDSIRAVILGSGINNDGSLKAGFTAPSVEGQHEAIVLAHAVAGIEPDTIDYVEGHGTATPLGDPIEVAALTRAFRERTSRRGFCALGSVKSNIGHTDTVAGLAGLTKAVLAIEHREIPPTVHFTRPNPALDLEASPFYVNTTAVAWPSSGSPRRAAVSSFGIGGTNAHLVLEEAPTRQPRPSSGRPQVLTLSARTAGALDAMTVALAAHLTSHPEIEVADAAFTLQEGRRAFEMRRTLVCRSRDEAIAALSDRDPSRVHDGRADGRAPAVAFMFSGQGSQYPGMGSGLYLSEPVFREAIDRCAETLEAIVGRDLRTLIFADRASDSAAAARLTMTEWAQPALFAIEYALAELWISRGIEPDAMIGHSLGEYVAATIAGVLSLEDALRLVAVRGRLMQSMPTGAMTAVPLSESEARSLLSADLTIAAVNAPRLVIASGPTPSIDAFESRLAGQGISCRRLHTSHAFHSSMMDGMLEPFRAELSRITLSPPTRRYVSNLTGTWITAEEATSRDYWIQHVRQPVRFADGITTMSGEPSRVWLEVGPGRALASLTRQLRGKQGTIVTSLRHPEESQHDDETLAATTAQLWRAGVAIDWRAVHAAEPRLRVALPTYPFERQRFWIDVAPRDAQPVATPSGQPPKRADVTNWFYVPSWTRSTPIVRRAEQNRAAARTCLLFRDRESIAEPVEQALRSRGYQVVSVHPADDIAAVIARLRDAGTVLDGIVHLWGIGEPEGSSARATAEQIFRRTYDSLIEIAREVGDRPLGGPCRVLAVSTGIHNVAAGDVLSCDKAVVAGLCRVIGLEYPDLACASIDIDTPAAGSAPERWIAEALAAELDRVDDQMVVAYRNSRRWVRAFELVQLDPPKAEQVPLRERGVYLLTGGFGGMALVLADMLASSARARLALVGRSAAPPRQEWDAYLAGHDATDRTSELILQVRALEAKGAEVMLLSADVADPEAMRATVQHVREQFGPIAGVIHAAGVGGGGVIADKDGAARRAAFAAKIDGTRSLFDALGGERPDWIVLCSSLNGVFPLVGAADYCAANAFLDAYAEAHDDPSGTRVIAIGWDTWQQVGMVVKQVVPEHLEDHKRRNLVHGMTNSEGQDVLRRILASPAPYVLVLTQGYEALRGLRVAPTVAEEKEEETSTAPTEVAAPLMQQRVSALSSHARPAVSSDYVAPEGEVEQQIAQMWVGLLGIDAIGRHDNFFELGGHSLLATQLISRIRDRFGLQLPLRTIFDANTIAALARHITTMTWALSAPVPAGQAAREEIDL